MKSRSESLRLSSAGAEVRRLHRQLKTLGLQVPESERRAGEFGEGTHAVVVQFQKDHRLDPTGVVSAATATALNSAAHEVAAAADPAAVDVGHIDVSPTNPLAPPVGTAVGPHPPVVIPGAGGNGHGASDSNQGARTDSVQ